MVVSSIAAPELTSVSGSMKTAPIASNAANAKREVLLFK
jgi:hypothetical protein